MSILLFPESANIESLDRLPEEIKTVIIVANNRLDKTLYSLLTSKRTDFEKNYHEMVSEFHRCITQIFYAIARRSDSLRVLKQLEDIFLSSLLQIGRSITNSQSLEAITLSRAIEAISEYSNIINRRDAMVIAFSTYLDLSVCVAALNKIITDRNNLYQKNKPRLIQICTKVTDHMKLNIEIIVHTNIVEQIIKESVIYLSKEQLKKLLPKEISNEILDHILIHLEFNNRIMYDKDGLIVWLESNELQEKALKKFTMLR